MNTKDIILNKDAKLVIEKLIALKKEKKIRNIDQLAHEEGRKEFKKIRNYFKEKKVEEVTWAKDIKIKDFKVRHYRCKNNSLNRVLPAMIFFHGGGWVLGDIETHDHVCRKLVNNANFDVISVGYSLAPESPFPCAVEEAIETLRWLVSEHKKININLEKILICGDSAGGNLASVLSIYNRDKLKYNIKLQILIYPVTSFSSNFPSKKKYDGLILSKDLMQWFEKKYLPQSIREKYLNDWKLSPIKASSLSNLPKTLLILAECDPLFDEGKYFGDLLNKNKNDVELIIYKGQIHGFLTMGGFIEDANNMINLIKKRANAVLKKI